MRDSEVTLLTKMRITGLCGKGFKGIYQRMLVAATFFFTRSSLVMEHCRRDDESAVFFDYSYDLSSPSRYSFVFSHNESRLPESSCRRENSV